MSDVSADRAERGSAGMCVSAEGTGGQGLRKERLRGQGLDLVQQRGGNVCGNLHNRRERGEKKEPYFGDRS